MAKKDDPDWKKLAEEQQKLEKALEEKVTKVLEQKAKEEKDEKQVKKFSPGLSYADAEAIRRVVPNVETTSGEVVLNTHITREGRRRLLARC